MAKKTRSSKDQKADVKNPTSKDFALDKLNTSNQLKENKPT
jgi:hypothetical protein